MAAGEDNGDGSTGVLTREVARNSVARLAEGLTRLAGETSAILRWLLAAMVALNASGFWLCLLKPDFVPAGRDRELLALFFSGVLAAIFAALLSLVLTLPLARSLRRAIAAWTEVSASGALSHEALAAARRVGLLSGFWLGLTSLVGLASLTLFGIGATIIAASFTDSDGEPGVALIEAGAPASPLVQAENVAAPPASNAQSAPPPKPTHTPRRKPSAAPRPVTKATPKPSPRPTPRPSASVAAPSPSATPMPSPSLQ